MPKNQALFEDHIQPHQELTTVSACVRNALTAYLNHLDGHEPIDLHALVLKQVEVPLFQKILEYTHGNQSRAATLLGLSRGTLRKKLQLYKLDKKA